MLGDLILAGTETFILVLVRMTGLFVVSPVFGRRNLPAPFKIGFAFFLAIIMTSTLNTPVVQIEENLFAYAILVLKEFMVGLVIGYISYLVLSAVYLAGQQIDMQIGFSMVNVLDPMSNIQVPITSNFYFIICILITLAINGHHMIIKALFDSFIIVPPGSATFDSQVLIQDMVRMLGNIFIISFKISAPVTAAILIADIAMGVVMRTVPQVNIFAVGMPLKILLGLVVIFATMIVFRTLANSLISGVKTETNIFLEHIR